MTFQKPARVTAPAARATRTISDHVTKRTRTDTLRPNPSRSQTKVDMGGALTAPHWSADPVPPLHFEVHIDGACSRNGSADAQGGWAAVFSDGREFSGADGPTTNIRMEMTAAIKALDATPVGSVVTITTDLLLITNTMTGLWRAKDNQDLWRELRALDKDRHVSWKWVRGHSGHPGNERANELAQEMARMPA